MSNSKLVSKLIKGYEFESWKRHVGRGIVGVLLSLGWVTQTMIYLNDNF